MLRGVWSTFDYHNRKRPPRKRTRVLVFILTVNNDWSQIQWRGLYVQLCHIGSGISTPTKTALSERCDVGSLPESL